MDRFVSSMTIPCYNCMENYMFHDVLVGFIQSMFFSEFRAHYKVR